MPAPNGTVARMEMIQGILVGEHVQAKMNSPTLAG